MPHVLRTLYSFHIRLIFTNKSNPMDPSKHETLNQCWLNAGSASKTMGQHSNNVLCLQQCWDTKWHISQALCNGFNYETYISPYRTPAVVWTAMHGSYVCLDRVRKYKRCSFVIQHMSYSLNECCIFTYRTQINAVCRFFGKVEIETPLVSYGCILLAPLSARGPYTCRNIDRNESSLWHLGWFGLPPPPLPCGPILVGI